MSFVATMKPKVTTSWFSKRTNRRVSPTPETMFDQTPQTSNQEGQKTTNDKLSTLLIESRSVIAESKTAENIALCDKLSRAIVAAEKNEQEEQDLENGTISPRNDKNNRNRTIRSKRSTFIKSLAHFDDDLTNFFLYNYSDHNGNHDVLHKILADDGKNKKNGGSNNGHHRRHASIATSHLDQASNHHKLTSAKILGLLVSWEFNIFDLFDLVGPNTFVIVGDGIIQHLHSLISQLGFDHARFLTALQQLGESYLDNPYHNQLHGADVAQALNWTLTIGGAASSFNKTIDSNESNGNNENNESNENNENNEGNESTDQNNVPKITLLASILAALAHDAAHPGVNNNYLIDISHPLALTYNDRSPLEHMHAATFFRILNQEECSFIPVEFKEKSRAMRGVIVNMILSTDMMQHGNLIGTLKNRLKKGSKLTNDGRDIQMVLNICLHLADISNPARKTEIAVPWAKRIQEEFWSQGDKVREYNAEAIIAPMNDRKHAESNITHESNLQIGFTLGLVKPLFLLVNTISGVCLDEPIAMIDSNLETYLKLKEQNLPMTMENVNRILEFQIR